LLAIGIIMSRDTGLAPVDPAGGVESPQRRPLDRTDYQHRHFVNLLAAAALLALGFGVSWAVLAIDDYEAHEKCLASGRRDCVQIYAPPRGARSVSTPSLGRP
jgi:hypothetical protein